MSDIIALLIRAPACWTRPRRKVMQITNASPTEKGRGKKLIISIQVLAFLFGLTLLSVVIYRIGFSTIIETVRPVGFGFLVIVALNQSRHLLRALTMYLAVAPEHRNFKYRSAVAARLGGDAVNLFSFAGPFLGDATKAVLLKKNVSLVHGASAVIIDNILYYVTVILVVLGGVVTLLVTRGNSDAGLNRVLLAIAIVAVLLFIGLAFAILSRIKPLTHVIEFFDRRSLAPEFILRKRDSIADVETNVFHFYHDRPADFLKVFSISLGVHVISVTEVYTALTFLGQQAYVADAFIIESLTKVINASFSFIPGVIGVYEGGNELILSKLGYATAVGVSLALVRRGAILISTSIGLGIILWRTAESGVKRFAKGDDSAK